MGLACLDHLRLVFIKLQRCSHSERLSKIALLKIMYSSRQVSLSHPVVISLAFHLSLTQLIKSSEWEDGFIECRDSIQWMCILLYLIQVTLLHSCLSRSMTLNCAILDLSEYSLRHMVWILRGQEAVRHHQRGCRWRSKPAVQRS